MINLCGNRTQKDSDWSAILLALNLSVLTTPVIKTLWFLQWKSPLVLLMEQTCPHCSEFPMADHHLRSWMPSTPSFTHSPSQCNKEGKQIEQFTVSHYSLCQHMVPLSGVCVNVCLCDAIRVFYFPYISALIQTSLFSIYLGPPLSLALIFEIKLCFSVYFCPAFLGLNSDLKQTLRSFSQAVSSVDSREQCKQTHTCTLCPSKFCPFPPGSLVFIIHCLLANAHMMGAFKRCCCRNHFCLKAGLLE